jgi:hypothetical protein
MSDDRGIEGPVILWVNYGYDGWRPTSYLTLKDALLADRYASTFVFTRLVEYEVVDLSQTDGGSK